MPLNPLHIPADFWDREPVTTALTDQDFTALFKLARRYAGATQTQIAVACNLSQSKVSQIQTGKHQPSAHNVRRRIADGFNMPNHARTLLDLGALTPDPTPAPDTASPDTRAPHKPPRTFLAHLIRERDLTYEEAAALVGLSARHLSRMARQGRPLRPRDLRASTRRALQSAFGRPIDDLLRPWHGQSDQTTTVELEQSTTDIVQASARPPAEMIAAANDLMEATEPADDTSEHAPTGTFGQALLTLRTVAGLSLDALAQRARYSKAAINFAETGQRDPSRELALALDHALNANGHLIELAALQRSAANTDQTDLQRPRVPGRTVEIATHPRVPSAQVSSPADAPHDEDQAVKRRRFLQDVASVGLATSMAGVEKVRHDLVAVLGHNPDPDMWPEIVAEYARSFYLTHPDTLLRDLTADLQLIEQQLSNATDRTRPLLCRTAGQLAAVTAMACASLGQRREALRWWATARDASDKSRDRATRVWARGWEVANGLYERRPIRIVLDRGWEARSIAGSLPDAGTAGLLAGLSQTLAVAGHPDAISTLREVAILTENMPREVANDHDSMFGWPEVRLRHTESYVYTTLGDTARAYVAQDAALALYGSDLVRERAALLLHRSQCMIKDGDVTSGLAYAHDVLDQLPGHHHTELVYSMARNVVDVVPSSDTRRQAVGHLRDRLALPSGPS